MTKAERAELVGLAVILMIVGVAAGAASFTHMHDWTMDNSRDGTPGWFGWANACISELVPVAALLKIRQRRRAGGSITYPLFLLIISAALSLAAQLAVAERSPSGWLLSAVPALAFIMLVKLVLSGSPARATAVVEEDQDDQQPFDELYDEPDPWGYAKPRPQEPETSAEHGSAKGAEDDVVEDRPEVPAGFVPRHRPASKATADAVRAAAAELPANAKPAEIAARAKVSESTVSPIPAAVRAATGAREEGNSAARQDAYCGLRIGGLG